VIVEPALAEGASTAIETLGEHREVAPGVEAGGVVRVDAGGPRDTRRVACRYRRRAAGGVDRFADADDLRGSRAERSSEHVVAILVEGGVGEVGVAIDEPGSADREAERRCDQWTSDDEVFSGA
jgi:hypothetical protein